MKKQLSQGYYQHITNLESLDLADLELLKVAKNSLKHSYAPYSDFKVACAIRLDDGAIHIGTNQENASYPLSLCAERVVLLYAKANFPDSPIESIAITVSTTHGPVDEPVTPCGACRQVISEVQSRQQKPIRLILNNGAEECYLIDDASWLLPIGFHSGNLFNK